MIILIKNLKTLKIKKITTLRPIKVVPLTSSAKNQAPSLSESNSIPKMLSKNSTILITGGTGSFGRAFLNKLIDSDRLGQKTRAGFYKKNEERSIHSVDLKTGE